MRIMTDTYATSILGSYSIWDLASKEARAGEKYNDPMIPTLREFHSKTYVNSDEALLDLAARKTRGGP